MPLSKPPWNRRRDASGRAWRAVASPAVSAALALGIVAGTAAAPAAASDGDGELRWSPLSVSAAGECTFPAADVAAVPWSLQRIVLDQLWKGGITGKGVTVAVIDTGVDNHNPQLAGAGKVEAGRVLLKGATGGATEDPVGHGTKVAGIIAARRSSRTGFVGLAPDATILAIRQNDSEGSGNVDTLAQAIDSAVKARVQVINISQDVRSDGQGTFAGRGRLALAVQKAVNAGIVVVASSGNDGKEGPTYPAAFDGVLAVGASDRNNERASFSEYGDFVDVAAPGVDMLSTVPRGGQCVDNGTSFSAPYVAGVAALLRQKYPYAKYPQWTAAAIEARIEQTAQRNQHGRNKFIGWGVVDPVKAVTSDAPPAPAATPDPQTALESDPIVAQPLTLGETQADRDRRTATYVLGAGALTVALVGGGSIVLRDYRRRRTAA